jgi:hypothetical protein
MQLLSNVAPLLVQKSLHVKYRHTMPANPATAALDGFFTKTPRRQSANATAQLAFRTLP